MEQSAATARLKQAENCCLGPNGVRRERAREIERERKKWTEFELSPFASVVFLHKLKGGWGAAGKGRGSPCLRSTQTPQLLRHRATPPSTIPPPLLPSLPSSKHWNARPSQTIGGSHCEAVSRRTGPASRPVLTGNAGQRWDNSAALNRSRGPSLLPCHAPPPSLLPPPATNRRESPTRIQRRQVRSR